MSLTFSDQHLAWQQRVGKEVTTASKILQAFNQFPNYNKSRRSTSLESRHHTSTSKKSKNINENLFQALQKTYMQSSLGVYSEVRGKYARPAPQLNQITKNPVLNRPSTAGSLRPRTSRGQREENMAEKEPKAQETEEIVKRPNSSLDFCMRSVSSRRSKRSKRSISRSEMVKSEVKPDPTNATPLPTEPLDKKPQETVKFSLPEASPSPSPSPIPESPPDDSPTEPDPALPQPIPPDTVSIPSTKTTSSHRRYISELESLLKEEQEKRKRLEAFLHSLISNNLK